MTKSELRKLYLEKRKAVGAQERGVLSQSISENFFQTFDLSNVRVLHCFISIKKFYEIDTSLIFQQLWQDFPQIITAVPRVDRETGELDSLLYLPETDVAMGNWQIPEPTHNETVNSAAIDLVIVPLVCFDLAGHRVGYGKGYYDRFLKRCRTDCLKVGLSYFGPVETIPEAHDADIPLDFCITPEVIQTFNN